MLEQIKHSDLLRSGFVFHLWQRKSRWAGGKRSETAAGWLTRRSKLSYAAFMDPGLFLFWFTLTKYKHFVSNNPLISCSHDSAIQLMTCESCPFRLILSPQCFFEKCAAHFRETTKSENGLIPRRKPWLNLAQPQKSGNGVNSSMIS